MRRDWFRFDPATLLAVLLVGLVPTLLLLLISFLYIKGMSFPLYDLVRAPHQQAVVQQCDRLEKEYTRWCRSLDRTVQAALGTPPDGAEPASAGDSEFAGADPETSFEDWDLVSDLVLYLESHQDVVPHTSIEARDSGETLLRSIAHETDPARRDQALAALAAIPLSAEDPVGFSYALEATLLRSEKITASQQAEFLAQAGFLDSASVAAYQERCSFVAQLPGIPVPVRTVQGYSPTPPGVAELTAPNRLRLSLTDQGAGRVLCEVRASDLLRRFLDRLAETDPPPPGTFSRITPIGTSVSRSPDDVPERVWAERPLPPPFQQHWQLISGSRGEEALNPLIFLNRLEGIHYLWGGLVVLAVGLFGSLLLAGLVSRRVELSRRKDTFLRLVSHELRTPISSISMLAETLALNRVRTEEERGEFLGQMQSETVRLADLVERVLEFGRTSSGKVGVREVVTDPGELVEEVVHSFRERFKEGPDVALQTAQQFHPVLLDREAIRGVVMNLLTNAQKHSPVKSLVEVTVGEESRHLFIRVRDHGSGIGRRDLRRIFRPFERGEVGAGAPGFGLGLAYCREVAMAHGGKIKVRSRVGEGSSFTLEIPLVRRLKGSGSV